MNETSLLCILCKRLLQFKGIKSIMQLVYNKICNLSRRILQKLDKNAGFLIKVAKTVKSAPIIPRITRIVKSKPNVTGVQCTPLRGNIKPRFSLVGEGLAPPASQNPNPHETDSRVDVGFAKSCRPLRGNVIALLTRRGDHWSPAS